MVHYLHYNLEFHFQTCMKADCGGKSLICQNQPCLFLLYPMIILFFIVQKSVFYVIYSYQFTVFFFNKNFISPCFKLPYHLGVSFSRLKKNISFRNVNLICLHHYSKCCFSFIQVSQICSSNIKLLYIKNTKNRHKNNHSYPNSK